VVKLPLPPAPAELQFPAEHLRVVETDTVLWRVHRTSGDHVVPWNQLHYWGPATTTRFDPHEPPAHVQGRGVSYTALTVPTALAEVFQRTRVINTRRGTPYLTAWSPARPLTLLDLTGTWPIQSGASHAINTGRRDTAARGLAPFTTRDRTWTACGTSRPWPEAPPSHCSPMQPTASRIVQRSACPSTIPDYAATYSQPHSKSAIALYKSAVVNCHE
jgi:hypothetical protein